MEVLLSAARTADPDVVDTLYRYARPNVDALAQEVDEDHEHDEETTCTRAAMRLHGRHAPSRVIQVVRKLAELGVPLGHLRVAAAVIGDRELGQLARSLGDNFGDARAKLCRVCHLGIDARDDDLECAISGLKTRGWDSSMIELHIDGILPWFDEAGWD
jgi:hypothetical protein